jgi:hypothetical protein
VSEQTETATIPTHRYCPDCGRGSDPGHLFCGRCGRSLTKSVSHVEQDASNDLLQQAPSTHEAAEESAPDASPLGAGAPTKSLEATISQPAQTTNTPARSGAWIRRHRGISIAIAAVLVLCVVGGISNAVRGPQGAATQGVDTQGAASPSGSSYSSTCNDLYTQVQGQASQTGMSLFVHRTWWVPYCIYDMQRGVQPIGPNSMYFPDAPKNSPLHS